MPGSTDLGRFLVTAEGWDRHALKTPTLRNVALTYPYFNNGNVPTLDQAIVVMGQEMLGIELAGEESEDLVAFMHALTGEIPAFSVPALPWATFGGWPSRSTAAAIEPASRLTTHPLTAMLAGGSPAIRR